MTDNSLLIIAAGFLSAVVHLVMTPLWLWIIPQKKAPGPFMLVLVYFPLGALLIYGALYVVYMFYFTYKP